MNPIQGTDAILSFLTNDWTPYVCTSDVSIEIQADLVAIRTQGDGQWKKFDYQGIGYKINLQGIMVFADPNIRTWDMVLNQAAFLTLPFRLSFTDDEGNSKTFQGTVLIETANISGSVGQVVKNTLSLTGSGSLIMFDGLVPCATTIDSITITGTSSPTGIITIDFTSTGDLFRIKYQFDGAFPIYVQGPSQINFQGLLVGAHTVLLTPICTNGFEGTPLSKDFVITQNQSCNTTITAITVDLPTLTAVAVFTGTAQNMQYRIDAGTWVIVPISNVVDMKGLAPGNHSIEMVPLCSVGPGGTLQGTGFIQNFTITSTPGQSTINYNFQLGSSPGGIASSSFAIYRNGLLAVIGPLPATGSIQVNVGDSIRAQVTAQGASQRLIVTDFVPVSQTVTDQTTATVLSNQSAVTAFPSLTFTFTANGDVYLISQSVGN